jgi:transcriptional regulator with XRE-family HTH domain
MLSVTSRQIKAARALLGWSAKELAERCGIHCVTLARIESGRSKASKLSAAAIARVVTEAGLEILREDDDGGIGVRLRHRGT